MKQASIEVVSGSWKPLKKLLLSFRASKTTKYPYFLVNSKEGTVGCCSWYTPLNQPGTKKGDNFPFVFPLKKHFLGVSKWFPVGGRVLLRRGG